MAIEEEIKLIWIAICVWIRFLSAHFRLSKSILQTHFSKHFYKNLLKKLTFSTRNKKPFVGIESNKGLINICKLFQRKKH